ncbi:MAG: DUF1553 domain-containing protein, partial [Planctomycetales bacterium]|nr:DUF1553 domain-containing protein [Planctomycetales bacterium]
QCHDHKLDAVEQRDFYALAGTLMSTRWNSRTVDAEDPNVETIASLGEIKQRMRAELARLWLDAAEQSADKIKTLPADDKAAERFPETLLAMWQRAQTKPLTAAEFREQHEQRIAANSERLTLLADFTRERGEGQWRWDGWGMRHGLVADGAIVVADEGDSAIQQLLPAGRWSHVWSPRLAGSLQSPLFDPRQPITFSIGMAAGKFAASSFVVDRALNSERMQFVNQPSHGWSTRTAGNFSSLEGSVDTADRLVHWELVTKSLNNYFPPRTGYGGLNEAELHDPRSWFGVTRIYQHAAGQPPQDELGRFAPLFAENAPAVAADSEPPTTDAWAKRLAELLLAAVRRWADERCDDEDVRLLNEAIQLKLLPNQRNVSPALERLVAEYRDVEQRIVPDRTVGSADDWHEGRDERVGIRGSYTEFGEATPRGRVRLLDTVCPPTDTASASVANSPEATDSLASGRLELGQQIVDPRNPLTARVYVNRVWHYLFGEGLVRTPDDFGHLGEPPTHPELLDYLADRFVREGWSTKRLLTLLVTSATWRQSHNADSQAAAIDPENRLWYEMRLRRLEAEAIRDAMLVVSGRYDPSLFGPPIEPFRTAEDPAKRLFVGPLDGHGRRSIYIEMTLMEPPRFLALFNQPLPKTTVGRRDVTNVPDQALALLNDPLVIALAKYWSEQVVNDGANSAAARADRMFAAALGRPPSPEETERLVRLVERSAALHGAAADSLLACQPAWQDAAHALFNLKEFIYVP